LPVRTPPRRGRTRKTLGQVAYEACDTGSALSWSVLFSDTQREWERIASSVERAVRRRMKV
jgi:hypothetical protein